MGAVELVALVAFAILIAGAVCALVLSIAVRRVRGDEGEQGKPPVGI